MAAEDTKQLFAVHLRLFAVLLVLCAVVAQWELYKRRVHLGGQIGDVDLTRLDGVEVADAREDARVRVEVVERIFVVGDTFRVHILCTLERTARQAVIGQSHMIETRVV